MTARGERSRQGIMYKLLAKKTFGCRSPVRPVQRNVFANGKVVFCGRLRSRTRTVANDQLIEERIRARAHRLWEEEGRPEGRAEAHWEQARRIVALGDAQHTIPNPVQAPEAEPIELVRNLGEFPTPTDQGGEEQTYPSSSSTAGEPLFESTEPTLAAQEQLIAPPSPVGSPLTGPQVKKRGPSTAMMTAMDKSISPQLADAFFAAVREYVRWSYMGAEPGIN
jgi:hypothetical protein